jgi:hypothetical protein
MGICSDPATTYLKKLGYNVVRHPQEGIGPLQLIGRQGGVTSYLGSLDRLVVRSTAPTPEIEGDLVATDINGQSSSKLKVSVAANILGSVIGALGGGNLGIDASYTNARTVEFHFSDVLKDRVAPLEVGNYLRDAEVDSGNVVLAEYVLGNGRLYLIVDGIKTKKLTVKYERSDGVAAKVDVPLIQQIVGAKVSVSAESASSGAITYEGSKYLTFGFRCLEVGVLDGELSLVSSKPGPVVLGAVGDDREDRLAEEAIILTAEGVGLLGIEMAATDQV